MSGFFNLFKQKRESDELEQPLEKDKESFLNQTKDILQNMLNDLGFDGSVSASFRENKLKLDVLNVTDVGRVIGKDGRVIESIQTLVRAIAFKKSPNHKYHIIVDVENYFYKKIESAKKMAISRSQSITADNPIVSLGLKTAVERKAIHLVFEKKANFHTYSKGRGEVKEIFIELVKNGESE